MTWTTLRVSEAAPDGTAFDLVGPKDGARVVLIHGLGLSRKLWEAHLPAFAGQHVLLYDLYGHGESAPSREAASLSVFCEQIAALMDYVGWEDAHLVGFSIGGMINRRFALDHPARASSLVILNAPHDRGEDAQAAVEARAQAARDAGAFATFDAALKRWFTPEYLKNSDGGALVRAWRGQADAESYAQTAWTLAHGVRELIAPEPALHVPALVMTCENDSGSTPAMSAGIAAEIAGAELVIVPELQHLGLMEQPRLFTTPIVQFLNRVGAAATGC